MAGRAGHPHPGLPWPRPPGPAAPTPTPPSGSPKPPAAAAAPVIQVACPEARRGPPAVEPAPSPGRADWEVSPEGGRLGAGDPGERGSQALNPPEGCRSKTLVPRQRRCGLGAGAGSGRSLPPALRAGAPWPRTPGCQLRGGGRLRLPVEDRRPEGKLPKRPHKAFMELAPPLGLRKGVCPDHSQGTKL